MSREYCVKQMIGRHRVLCKTAIAFRARCFGKTLLPFLYGPSLMEAMPVYVM
jgi:hypothetical protein